MLCCSINKAERQNGLVLLLASLELQTRRKKAYIHSVFTLRKTPIFLSENPSFHGGFLILMSILLMCYTLNFTGFWAQSTTSEFSKSGWSL